MTSDEWRVTSEGSPTSKQGLNDPITNYIIATSALQDLLKKGKNTIFIPIFLGHSHFGPYFLFLPLLVPTLENAFRCCPYRYLSDIIFLCDKKRNKILFSLSQRVNYCSTW